MLGLTQMVCRPSRGRGQVVVSGLNQSSICQAGGSGWANHWCSYGPAGMYLYESTQRLADALEVNVRQAAVGLAKELVWYWTKRVGGASRRLVGQAGWIPKDLFHPSLPVSLGRDSGSSCCRHTGC